MARKQYTQDMEGNQAFPEKLGKGTPTRNPQLSKVPQKVAPYGAFGEDFAGYGEQGTENEINEDAPYGNIKLTPAGKFVQQQFHKGTDLNKVSPAETTIRNVRVADLGPEFGRGELDGSVELAGEKRNLPKWLPVGGKSHLDNGNPY